MPYFSISEETKLYYQTYNIDKQSKKTIVFINGLAMSTLGWRPQIEYFKQNYNVIVYDQRCQGLSSKEIKPFHHTLLVDDLNLLLNNLEIEKAVVCGISYGSVITKGFALKYPERCEKIVLLSPIFNVDFVLRHCYKIWFDLLEKDLLEEFYEVLFYMSFNRDYIEKIKDLYPSMLTGFKKYYDCKSVILLLKSLDYEKDFNNYSDINIPALIIGASQDRLHNPQDAKSIGKQIKNSTVEMLKGGHAISIENIDGVNNAIEFFISR